jgi:hypothetical protein
MNDKKKMDKDTRDPGITERNGNALVLRWSMLVRTPHSNDSNYKYTHSISVLTKIMQT